MSHHHIPVCYYVTEETKGGVCVCVYLELRTDVLIHELDRLFLDDLEVPGAEDLHGQDAVRLVDSEALPERLGHAVGNLHVEHREKKGPAGTVCVLRARLFFVFF